jgi:hypothetical protein
MVIQKTTHEIVLMARSGAVLAEVHKAVQDSVSSHPPQSTPRASPPPTWTR